MMVSPAGNGMEEGELKMKDKIFGVFTARGAELYVADRNSARSGTSAWDRQFLYQCDNDRNVSPDGDSGRRHDSTCPAHDHEPCGQHGFDNLPLLLPLVWRSVWQRRKKRWRRFRLLLPILSCISIYALLLLHGEIAEDGQIADFVLEGSITSVCGIPSLQIGVFGGIIVGTWRGGAAQPVLPDRTAECPVLFGGTRFVPIISTVVYLFAGIFCSITCGRPCKTVFMRWAVL